MWNSSENSYDVIVIKYNTLGTMVWNVTWGGVLDDYAYALAINTTSSRLYVTGRTASYGIGGSNDIFIVSYDASGILQKNITWGGDTWDVGFDITCTSEFVYVIGYSDSFSSSQDIAVLKYNSSYSLLWNNTYSTSESDIGFGISIDSSDNAVLTGKITSSGDTNAIVNTHVRVYVNTSLYKIITSDVSICITYTMSNLQSLFHMNAPIHIKTLSYISTIHHKKFFD